MKIIFRADGNANTGLGHLFRIFALVEMLKDNYDYRILTKESSTLEVFPKQYKVDVIQSEININDEPKWLELNYSSSEYFIIADGYQFTSSYQHEIKKIGYKFAYIDDFAKEKIYADLVINHSISVNKSDFSFSSIINQFALGTDYAMLRPLFLEEAKKDKKISKIKNIFICFGGADFYDITNTCVKGALRVKNVEKINVVIGQAYKHKEINNTLKENNERVILHKNLSELGMINLMKHCQLAILPSSTISYEVCCVKMLALVGYYIDNQKMIYDGLKENKLIEPLDDLNELTAVDFENKIEEISNKEKDYFQEMITNQHKYFDGKQKERFLKITKEIVC